MNSLSRILLFLGLAISVVQSFVLSRSISGVSLRSKGKLSKINNQIKIEIEFYKFLESRLNSIKIVCSEDEPIENILRRFKRGVNQSGHLFDLRFKERHENNHDKKKRKVTNS
jgi:ribosomal protein S21